MVRLMDMARASSSPDASDELASSVGCALSRVPSVRVAFVFGSRVTGRARIDSDLDVAVVYDRTLTDREREAARRDVLDELAASLGALGERADVVDLDRCDSSVAFSAIKHGRLALARSEPERVRTVVAIARRFDDDAPKRALFRRAAVDAMKRATHG